jgi:hypothetical protein
MSLSEGSLIRSHSTLDREARAQSGRAVSTRRGTNSALLCALAAGVLGLATPGTAHAEGEPSGAAPEGQPSAADAKVPSEATPQDRAGACLENHAQGQEFRLSAKLLEGRDAFLRCSATHCPAQIQRDCLNYMEQIQLQIPSVAFRVTADGVSRADVKVFLDGNLVLEKLSGKALDLNPGNHEVRVILEPFAPYEQSLVVSEGDKFRMVEVAFATPTAPAAPEPPPREMHRPIPLSSYIFGSIGAAALINGVAWGVSSWGLQKDLESSCAPRCQKESVDVLRQRALIADASWGVSAASLAVASIFYLLRPEVPVEGSVQVGVARWDEHGAIGTISVEAF